MNKIKKPSTWMNFSEVFRAMYDFKKSSEFVKTYHSIGAGDGHPVIVIPGFLGSKTTTIRLRKFIDKLGYKSYDWGRGTNLGNLEDINALIDLIEQIAAKHQQKVTLIGWSLGGVYARELSKMKSDLVRQCITLGAPFADINAPNHASWLIDWMQGDVRLNPNYTDLLEKLADPAPVPSTAIYSKEDGVVPWEVCREPVEDRFHQNVEVKGSHLGLPINASVWYLISDRLRYKAENWEPFSPKENMPDSVFFPSFP